MGPSPLVPARTLLLSAMGHAITFNAPSRFAVEVQSPLNSQSAYRHGWLSGDLNGAATGAGQLGA
ncbi:MAG: hypothetical protein U0Y68_01705 [Blastocatellia bacterium]